jgi:lipopolysaccharide export system permease protein
MSIFDRYLLKRFFLTFFVAMFCFVIVFDVVNLIEQIGKFLESEATFGDIFMYYVYFTPFIVVLTCPIATLLASIFSVGLLARNNELTAMKSAGVSLYRLTLPLLLGGVVIAMFLWIFGEMVMPEANFRKDQIKMEKIDRKQPTSKGIYRNQLFQGLGGRVFHFSTYNAGDAEGQRVIIQTFAGSKLKSVVTAERFDWQDSIWIGHNVEFSEFKDFRVDPKPIKSWHEDYHAFSNYAETPAYFDVWFTRQDAQSLSYFKLLNFIQVSRAIGRDVTPQVVDLENKIAFPFINVIIILIGVALASNPRRSGLAIGFGISMCISFVFYTVVKIAIELGHQGTIPPLVAAWGANVIFFIFGLYLLVRTPK